jgi:hypothetical protein
MLDVAPGVVTNAALEYFGTSECTASVRGFLWDAYRTRCDEDADASVERLLKHARKQIDALPDEAQKRVALLFGGDPLRVLARQAAHVHGGATETLWRLARATGDPTGALMHVQATQAAEKPVLSLSVSYLPAGTHTSAFVSGVRHLDLNQPIISITASGKAMRNAFGTSVAALPEPVCPATVTYKGVTLAGMVFPGNADTLVSFASGLEALTTMTSLLQAVLFFAARGVPMARSGHAGPNVLYMHPSGARLSPLACAVPAMYAAASDRALTVLPACRETSLVFLVNLAVATRAFEQIIDALKYSAYTSARDAATTSFRALVRFILDIRGKELETDPKDATLLERIALAEASANRSSANAIQVLVTDELARLVRCTQHEAGLDAQRARH